MLPDHAVSSRELEYQNLIAGISDHKGAPPLAETPAVSAPACNVDPYQDPAYNQPHGLVENAIVETPEVEAVQLLPAMQACIDECFECHKICLNEAMGEGRETGQLHSNPNFFRMMINCAEICQTTANFLLSGSPLHGVVCDVCAQTCEACATSCDKMGHLDACAAQCRKCAASCREMAQIPA